MYFDKTRIVDVNNLVNNKYSIFAHMKDGLNEPLKDHTSLCMKYFLKIIESKNIESVFGKIEKVFLENFSKEEISIFREMIINTIIFHDIGKVNPYFQKDRLNNDLNLKVTDKFKNSHHSMLSAVIYIDYYFDKIKMYKGNFRNTLLNFMMMNAYVISRHHGELNSFYEFMDKFNIGGEGEKLICDQRELFEFTYKNKVNIESNTIRKVFKTITKYKADKQDDVLIYQYIYERLMLSILVACDFYSTSEFMDGLEIRDIGTINDIDEFYNIYKRGNIYKSIRKYEKEKYNTKKDFSKIEDINVLRNEMFLDAEKKLVSNINSNIFYLEAPTGSGKSNVATNLSFRLLAEDKEKNKIFYVYPFNTLVEQNINVLKKVFNQDENLFNKLAVINSVEPIKLEKEIRENEEEKINLEYYKKALLNRQFLNYPMVLTTHVTIFKYLFGTSKEDVFPLHQLVNSVIVLDEIQSYKNLIWGEIITFLTAYSKLLNIKIIIMSATLPDLNKLTLSKGNTINLIEDRNKYFRNPIFKNRVTVNYDLLVSENIFEDLYIHVKQKSSCNKKILIEFISKSSAYKFYNKLKEDSEILCEIELMTGDDNIVERERILKKVSKSSNIILVATQVIEAGVDIDMDIGYKNISLFDCEEQFLGRINRSCQKTGSIVYFFKLDEASNIYKEDVRNNKDITLFSDYIRKILNEKDFNQYYDEVLKRLKSITGGFNRLNIENFFKDDVGKLDFKKVEAKMKLISDEKHEINVYLSSNIVKNDGEKINGDEIWSNYKKLLLDTNMNYSERRVKLSDIRSKMNNFIYKIKWNNDFPYNDRIGELYYIEEGDKYFKEGKFDREKFISGIGDFI